MGPYVCLRQVLESVLRPEVAMDIHRMHKTIENRPKAAVKMYVCRQNLDQTNGFSGLTSGNKNVRFRINTVLDMLQVSIWYVPTGHNRLQLERAVSASTVIEC